MPGKKLTRRDFVKSASSAALGLAAGAAAGPRVYSAAAKPSDPARDILNHQPSMRYRRLGKTDLMVSELSFGGHWRNREGERYWGTFPNDEPPPDVQRDREDVVGRAIDLGINYLDITTPAEATIYGRVLKSLGARMHVGYSDYILCIRNPANRTPEKIMFEIDEGLRRLQMDCYDIFRPQALTDGKHTDDEMKTVVETFMKAKEQGKVKHLGMSSHDRPFHMHIMETFPEFEMLIFPFGAVSKQDVEHSIFPLAKEKDVGVVTIKPFSGGSLFRAEERSDGEEYDKYEVASLAIRHIVSNEYITATVPGMTTIDELECNVQAGKHPSPLADAEAEKLSRHARAAMDRLPPDYAWLRQWEYV